MQLIIKLFTYFPAIMGILARLFPVLEQFQTNQQCSNVEVDQGQEKVYLEVLQSLAVYIDQLKGEGSSFFKDIIAKVAKGGELTPLGLIVKDALADGVISKKEMALIILAYELEQGTIDTKDIVEAEGVEMLFGYKSPSSIPAQVTRKLKSLTSRK